MSLKSSLSIAAQGLSAASDRMQIYANNIANLGTPNYVRKVPVLSENQDLSFDDMISQMRGGVLKSGLSASPGGVVLNGSVEDPTPGKKIYMPSHPEADKNGYLTLSNVNPMADMADATLASRVYEANLAVIGIVKAMASRALEIGRGQ